MPTKVNRDGHIPSHINGLNVLLINSFDITLQWRDAMKSDRKARDSLQRGWKVQFVWEKYIFKNYNLQARLSSRKSARWFQRRIVPVGGKQLPFQDQLDTETQVWTKYMYFFQKCENICFLFFRFPSATTQSKVQNTHCSTSSSSTFLLSLGE